MSVMKLLVDPRMPPKIFFCGTIEFGAVNLSIKHLGLGSIIVCSHYACKIAPTYLKSITVKTEKTST